MPCMSTVSPGVDIEGTRIVLASKGGSDKMDLSVVSTGTNTRCGGRGRGGGGRAAGVALKSRCVRLGARSPTCVCVCFHAGARGLHPSHVYAVFSPCCWCAYLVWLPAVCPHKLVALAARHLLYKPGVGDGGRGCIVARGVTLAPLCVPSPPPPRNARASRWSLFVKELEHWFGALNAHGRKRPTGTTPSSADVQRCVGGAPRPAVPSHPLYAHPSCALVLLLLVPCLPSVGCGLQRLWLWFSVCIRCVPGVRMSCVRSCVLCAVWW
jgi:hypothetical protein